MWTERNGLFLKGGSSVERMRAWSGVEEKSAIQKNWASALWPPQTIHLDRTRTTPGLRCPYPAPTSHMTQMAGHSQSFAFRPHQLCFLKFLLGFLDTYLSLLDVGTIHMHLLVYLRCRYGGKEFHSTHSFGSLNITFQPSLVRSSFSLLNIYRFCLFSLFIISLLIPVKRTIFQSFKNRDQHFCFALLHWGHSQH